jgi:hypothetical protein
MVEGTWATVGRVDMREGVARCYKRVLGGIRTRNAVKQVKSKVIVDQVIMDPTAGRGLTTHCHVV